MTSTVKPDVNNRTRNNRGVREMDTIERLLQHINNLNYVGAKREALLVRGESASKDQRIKELEAKVFVLSRDNEMLEEVVTGLQD